MSSGVERVKWQAGVQRSGFLAKLFERLLPGNGEEIARRTSVGSAQGLPVEMITLSGKELRVLEISQSGTISCLEGVVWLTFPRRFCDYILKAGESLTLRGEGRLVVSGGCRKCTIGISME